MSAPNSVNSVASTRQSGAGGSQHTCVKSKTGEVKYFIRNLGQPNECVAVVAEFNKPGSYPFSTMTGHSFPRHPTVLPAHREKLDEAFTFAVEMLNDVSSFSP